MKFEIYKQIYNKGWKLISPQWRWRLKARNGKIIAHGESYNNKRDCMKVIKILHKYPWQIVEVK